MHLAMPLQRMEWLGFAACAAVLALLASSLLLRLARDRTLRHTLHAVARRCEDRRLPRRALLVIAHPDDEAMFFSPTLLALAQAHVDVDVLCLSTGNFAGLGRTRTQELRAACGVLKVDKVSVIDHPQLQDGMRTHWADATMVDHMETAWAQASYDLVMTFDAYGVSGHINHRAVHRGVRYATPLPRRTCRCGAWCPPTRFASSPACWTPSPPCCPRPSAAGAPCA